MISFVIESGMEKLSVDAARAKYPNKYLLFKDYEPLVEEGYLAGYLDEEDLDKYNTSYDDKGYTMITPAIAAVDNMEKDCQNCEDCGCCGEYSEGMSGVDIPHRRHREPKNNKSYASWVIGVIAIIGAFITFKILRRKHHA